MKLMAEGPGNKVRRLVPPGRGPNASKLWVRDSTEGDPVVSRQDPDTRHVHGVTIDHLSPHYVQIGSRPCRSSINQRQATRSKITDLTVPPHPTKRDQRKKIKGLLS